MPEPGGTNTQWGINYQNNVAALFLGRLIDPRKRPRSQSVIEVRCEAPADVDDIVVRFADKHREWMQVKGNIDPSNNAWKRLWRHFERQRWGNEFAKGDKIVLVLGNVQTWSDNLRELCGRAVDSVDSSEWIERLSDGQKGFLEEKILPKFERPWPDKDALFALFSSTEILLIDWNPKWLKADRVPIYMPESNITRLNLFDKLFRIAGEGAITRRVFKPANLLMRLSDEGVEIYPIIKGTPKPAANEIWVGVPMMPDHLVGRDDTIRDLVEKILSNPSSALSLEGAPAVGKTALAVALAHSRELRGQFSGGVLWASLGPEATSADIMGIFNQWANALGVDVTDMLEISERKQMIQNTIGQRDLLIVIDDAWDIELARMIQFSNPNCCHLLTTRDKGLARKFARGAGTISVPSLTATHSFELLQALAPEVCEADPEAAQKLALTVGGLPLGVELLGSFLDIPQHSMLPDLSKEAINRMMDPHQRLKLAQERLGAPGQVVTLLDTISLSVAGLCELENGEELERTFYALGAFSPKPEKFSLEAATYVTGHGVEILAILVTKNLVELRGEQLALHQVVSDVAQTRKNTDAVLRHCEYYLDLVNRDREDWQRIENEYGQIKWAWRSVPQSRTMLNFIWALTTYQRLRGLWFENLEWIKRGLELARVRKWRSVEGMLLNHIGLCYIELGQREKAMDYFNQALPILEEVDDLDGKGATLHNIGLVYEELGQSDKALDYYDQALPIREELDNKFGQGITLHHCGRVYDSLGQREKALDYFNQALAIFKEIHDLLGQSRTLNSIGRSYRLLGQYDKAIEYCNRALHIQKEIGDQPGQGSTLRNIGLLYHVLGQFDKALEQYNQSLIILEKIGDKIGQADTLRYLARLYRGQGRIEEAVDLLKQVVELDRMIQDPYPEKDEAMLALVEAELAELQKH